MESLHWITSHVSGFLQAAGIIGSLLFTIVTLRRDARSRHTANLITLTAQHRDIWERFYDNPDLARIRDPRADLKKQPLSRDETLFVNLLILHLNCWYQAIRRNEITPPEGLGMDVGTFYSLPIPLHVWQQRKKFHDAGFVRFVDCSITEHSRPGSASGATRRPQSGTDSRNSQRVRS